MEDKCEKQIYKPLEVFERLVSLFDLNELLVKNWIFILDPDSGQSVIEA